MIRLDVKVGDTILMGRFKNKKVLVKTISHDEHGMPLVNEKPICTFRYSKE
jgi:co-chaperonin GroES (HSP10)